MSFGIPVRNGLMLGLGASTALSTRAGAKPAMFLNFLQPFLDSRITFSRGTGATRVNQSGFIEVVGNDTPRFDYDPVTLAPRGLLIEEARTNLLTYSEQFDNAAWVVQRSTITANATSSPSGTVSADKLVEDTTASNTHFVLQTATVLASTTYTYSVFLKAAERTRASLQDGGGSSAVGNFDLSNGTVISTSGATATITNMGNGWYRCAITFATIVAQTTANCRVFLIDTGTNTSYTGNGTSGIFVWGADLEAGSFATSYIPTVASTVTRNADVATMTGTNFSSWYNQSEGTFVYDASALSGLYGYRALLIARAAGGITDRIDMSMGAGAGGATGVFRDIVAVAGVTQVDIGDFANFVGNTAYKGALAYKLNDFAAATSGGNLTTDASGTIPTVALLDLGNRNSANFLNGHIRTIAYFNTRLPNAQLQTLTAPSLATTLSLDFTSGSYNVGF